VTQVGLLVLNDWIVPDAEALGFRPYDDVVTLQRISMAQPTVEASLVVVRSFHPAEMGAIIQVDLAAFSAPWMMSPAEIRQAERMASHVSVATLEGQIVGYHLSTLYFDGAHLARLAVLPEYQGRGVGRTLLADLIHRCVRRSIFAISVNTQASNTHSQSLYVRAGFQHNGHSLPVYTFNLL
jgi:ribosomal-protein-alanine N-acetyltransferase